MKPHRITTPVGGLAVMALATILLLPGCALFRDAPMEPEAVQWTLTPKARATYLYLRMEDAMQNNRPDEALQILEELVELSPSPTVFLEGANYLWRSGKKGESRTILKRGIKAYPDNRELPATLASTYLAEKRVDDAVLTLNDYLKRRSSDWEMRSDLAGILIESEKYAQALDVLKPVPEDQRTTIHNYRWAKAAAKLGRVKEGIAKLEVTLEKDPEFVEGWAELAYLYELEKDYVAAERTYSHILGLGEAGQEVWLRLILLNLKLNNPDTALGIYEHGPEGMDFALEAVTLFMDQGFYDHAREILDNLLVGEPAPNRIHFYRAVLAFEGDGDAEAAIRHLEKIPEDSSHYERGLRFRVHLLMELKNYDKALELAAKGKALAPDEPAYWLLEVEIYEARGDYSKAKELLDAASQRWPGDHNLLYSLGILLDKMDMKTEGIAVMERIIQDDPDHADALNYIGYTLADSNQDLERALVLINKALELKPDSGYIIDSLAWAYFRQGRLDESWTQIQRAVDKVDTDPTIWEHYGDVAVAKGLKEQARKGYSKSLELRPDNSGVEAKLKAL